MTILRASVGLGLLATLLGSSGSHAGPADVIRDALQRNARRAWWDLRAQRCGAMASELSQLDLVTPALNRAWLATSLCEGEIRREFLCELPDVVLESPNLLASSIDGAWRHRGSCLPDGRVGTETLGASLVCGLSLSARAQILRVASCIGRLKADEALGGLFDEMVNRGCKAVSRFAVSAVMSALSGHRTILSSLEGWVASLASSLTAFDWQAIQTKLGATSVEGAVSRAREIGGRYAECGATPAVGAMFGPRSAALSRQGPR